MNKVILISGSSFGVGKDTLGQMLAKECEKKNLRPRIMHFGDWVKDAAMRYYGWDGKKDDAGRYLLQHFATEQVRNYDWNYWAEVTYRLAAATKDDWDVLFVPDMRFPNEYECGTKIFNPQDMVTIKVVRELETNGANRNHISEHSMDEFQYSYTVDNNGTIDELEKKAGKLLDNILGM